MASSLINLPFVEIEVRLGCMDKHFDPAIDYNHVKTIVEALNFYDKWKSIDYVNSSEYIFNSPEQTAKMNVKLIESVTNGKEKITKLMMKESVSKETIILKDSPFDIRFVVNQEFALNHLLLSTEQPKVEQTASHSSKGIVPPEVAQTAKQSGRLICPTGKSTASQYKKENADLIRHKQRKSYVSNNFKYDITNVTEVTNNTPIPKYEIEIELLVNKETIHWTDEYIHSYLTCKIKDLINLIEPSKNELIIDFKKCSIK